MKAEQDLTDPGVTTPPTDEQDEMLRHYSAALDEIWRLRNAIEYEAQVLEAHLELKTFPKSRRTYAEQQLSRMRAAIKGDHTEYLNLKPWVRRSVGNVVGLLTRSQWESK